jgi:hypothetical protein
MRVGLGGGVLTRLTDGGSAAQWAYPFPNEVARHGCHRAGRWPVQLRYACPLTGAQYVSEQAWQEAILPRCPLHPQGGCHFARHGTSTRVSPPGTRVARWYCREGHCTFSLLPDCLAARLSGTLAEVEVLVALRGIAAPWLAVLPAPLGFAPRRRARASVGKGRQQQAGPDPPRRQA